MTFKTAYIKFISERRTIRDWIINFRTDLTALVISCHVPRHYYISSTVQQHMTIHTHTYTKGLKLCPSSTCQTSNSCPTSKLL